MLFFKQLFCKHPRKKYLRKAKGKEIFEQGYYSVWECKSCKKIIYSRTRIRRK